MVRARSCMFHVQEKFLNQPVHRCIMQVVVALSVVNYTKSMVAQGGCVPVAE